MTTRRTFLTMSAAALAAPALLRSAAAQAYPTRPIKAMVPFAAGSSLDIVGRIVMDPLSRQLGQTIVIENRGGAGGSIGTAMTAKADPDGHTLLIQASAHSAAPAAYPNLTYDPARDFSAVIPFGTIPNVTVVQPLARLQERAGPGGGGAQERPVHLWLGRRRQRHPLGGGTAAALGRLRRHARAVQGRAGSADRSVGGPDRLHLHGHLGGAAADPRRQAHGAGGQFRGALRGAAGRADDARSRAQGLRLQLLDGPVRAGEDAAAIIEKLYAETLKALAQPAVQDRFKPQGIEPLKLTSAEFDAMIKREVEANIALVKAAKLKFN